MSGNPRETEAQTKKALAVSRDAQRMALPAVYIDRFYISYWKGHIRLSFGERATHAEAGTFWRFAALLEKEDVEELIGRLQGILVDLEESEKPEKSGE